MKKKNRAVSMLIILCMIISMLTFAPSVFAETEIQPQNSTTQPIASKAIDQDSPSATAGEPTGESTEATTPSDLPQVIQYQINVIAQPTTGGAVKVDKLQAEEGETVSYKVTPFTGYKIVSIKVGQDTQKVTAPYGTVSGSFIAEGETTVSAVFEKLETYKITTSVNSKSRGSISATASVAENGSKTVTVKAKSGYYLADLQVDGKSVGAKYTYTFKNITKNYTVKAVFEKKIKIMLDAGHYANYNRSPVYTSYYESKMAWTLHNYLKEALEDYNGFYIGVTRSSQSRDMNVYNRGTASKGYDLFLSLHSNSSSSRTTDYPLIITQRGNTGDKLAKNLGKTIENTMNTKQAYKVWQRLNSDGRTEYYGVLRGSKSVGTKGMIIEHSFHTNLTATKWLSSNSNLKKMAVAEAKVIADYYDISKDNGSGSSGSSDSSSGSSDSSSSGSVNKPENKPTVSNVVSSSQRVKVTVSSLNMRKSYSTSSKSMGKAKKNAVYQLKAKTKDGKWGQLKKNGYWIYLKGYTKVVTSSSSSGSSSNKKPTVSKTVKSSQKVKVTVSSLNMRKSYSTGSKSMGKVKKNRTYQLKAKTRDGRWGQLKTNSYWIYLKGYTKAVSSSSYSSKSNIVKSSQKVKIKVSSLNMRKTYSTGSKSMGKARKNKTYQLKAKTRNGLWGQLKSNGYWIYLKKGYTKAV